MIGKRNQKRFLNTIFIIILINLIVTVTDNLKAQEPDTAEKDRDSLLSAAKEYIQSTRYCTLITIDSTGYPDARVMDPFDPDQQMVIWLGTNRNSRKVQEIKEHARVALFYYDNKGTGYVSVTGNASLIDNPEKKTKYWKPEWERFYKDKKDYILIKVVPEKLQVLNYQRGIYGDPKTWEVPSVYFNITGNE